MAKAKKVEVTVKVTKPVNKNIKNSSEVKSASKSGAGKKTSVAKSAVAKKPISAPKPAASKKNVVSAKPTEIKKAVSTVKKEVAKKPAPLAKNATPKKSIAKSKPTNTKMSELKTKPINDSKKMQTKKIEENKKNIKIETKSIVKQSAKPVEIQTNKSAAKEIKSAIKKAPTKKVPKNPALEAAKTAVIKPKVVKTADQMEQEMKKAAARVEDKVVQPSATATEVQDKKATTEKKPEPKKEEGEKSKSQKEKTIVKEKEPVKVDKKDTQKKETKKTSEKETQETEDNNIQPTDSTVRYSDEDLEMFERVIQEAKREALDELRMLKERLEDLNSYDLAEESMIYSMHMGEQGSEPMEKEKTYAQIQRINEYVKKLDEALSRIKEKTYGICRVCKILIAKERLLAVPITTLSASWKIHQKCPDDRIDRIEAI